MKIKINSKRVNTSCPDASKCKVVDDVIYANEAYCRWLLEISKDATLLHSDGKLITANKAAVKLFGANNSEQLIGKDIVNFIRPDLDMIRTTDTKMPNVVVAYNGQIIQLDGTVLDVEIIEKLSMYQGEASVKLVLRNLAEDQHLEPSSPVLVQYDGLSKLPNHRQFRDCLKGAIARAARNQQKVAVILLSVNQFKTTNATFGYQAGDFLLQRVNNCIKKCMRESDTAAWLGGDEFSFILEGLVHRDGAALMAQRLLNMLSLPLMYDGQKIPFTVSIGIALSTDDADDLELLMHNADLALYNAKKNKPNIYQFYTADMDNMDIRNKLRHTQIEQRLVRLTAREREVMEMMVIGNTSKMIACRLGVSIRTIEHHRANIMDKMQADSLPDLVRMIFDLREQ